MLSYVANLIPSQYTLVKFLQSTGTFSSLRVGFHLARKYGFHIWNIYIPGSLLVLMTWIGFWVPAMAYPARVTLLATSVFATIVIVPTAGSHLGPLSYAKAIDYYLLGNMTFLVMAMLEYIAILHVTANPDWFKIKATLPKLPFKVCCYFLLLLLFLQLILTFKGLFIFRTCYLNCEWWSQTIIRLVRASAGHLLCGGSLWFESQIGWILALFPSNYERDLLETCEGKEQGKAFGSR